MLVMKFGGTSVRDAKAITRVTGIVKTRLERKPVVVVSAFSKVTDLLYRISDAAAANDRILAENLLNQLRQRHLDTAIALLAGTCYETEAIECINGLCDRLVHFVDAVCMVGDLSPKSKAYIISRGEVLSSNVICFAMNANGIRTRLIDARKLIITYGDYLKGEPDIEAINAVAPGIVAGAYKGMDAVITQGFVTGTAIGETAVLGRGGSDYSASIIGMAIDAERVEIWTDVNGVMTADPRVVPNSRSLEKISFEEAAEMAHFGAKVLHPMTIEPAVCKNIPIYVLNSMNPSGPGTGIYSKENIEDGVKAVSSKEDILVINIFSTRMVNASGFLNRVFGIFSDHKVPVDMISTSEANISVTVEASSNVERVLEELSSFAEVSVDRGKAQISVIGKNIIEQKDIFIKIFSALNGHGVYMISQGATYINVSMVVDKDFCKEGLNRIHSNLFD